VLPAKGGDGGRGDGSLHIWAAPPPECRTRRGDSDHHSPREVKEEGVDEQDAPSHASGLMREWILASYRKLLIFLQHIDVPAVAFPTRSAPARAMEGIFSASTGRLQCFDPRWRMSPLMALQLHGSPQVLHVADELIMVCASDERRTRGANGATIGDEPTCL